MKNKTGKRLIIATNDIQRKFDETRAAEAKRMAAGHIATAADADRKRWADEEKAKKHAIEALRWLAKEPCGKRNCGTVCLCESCHARKALELWKDDDNHGT